MFSFNFSTYSSYNVRERERLGCDFYFLTHGGDIERFKLHPPWRLAQLFAFRYNSIVMNGFNVFPSNFPPQCGGAALRGEQRGSSFFARRPFFKEDE